VTDAEVIDAFQLLARAEGIIPALECCTLWPGSAKHQHAGKDGVDEPVGSRRQGRCSDDGHPGPMTGVVSSELETALRRRRCRRSQVAGAVHHGWLAGWQQLRAVAASGADAIEIGCRSPTR
jgi:hypothetical protein